MSDPVEIVRCWIAAFNARDEAALLALACPDIVLRPLRWGVRPEYHGHAGLREWLTTLAANPESSTVRPATIQALPDGRVLVEGVVDSDGTGFIGLYRFRDGRIREVHGYMSDRGLLAQLGLIASRGDDQTGRPGTTTA